MTELLNINIGDTVQLLSMPYRRVESIGELHRWVDCVVVNVIADMLYFDDLISFAIPNENGRVGMSNPFGHIIKKDFLSYLIEKNAAKIIHSKE